MNNTKNTDHNFGLKKYGMVKFVAIAVFLATQFVIAPTFASQSSLSGSISYSGTQHPSITMTVQNFTDYLGHSDILQASTSYSGDQINIIVNGHLSRFGTGSTTFNLDVLPIGTYSIAACDKQALFCSNTITVSVIGAPAASAPQSQNPGSGTSVTQTAQTSQPSSANAVSNSSTNTTVGNNSTLSSNTATTSGNNATTTSYNGGASVTSILPVLLGIAIAVALGYTLINNRRKKAEAAA